MKPLDMQRLFVRRRRSRTRDLLRGTEAKPERECSGFAGLLGVEWTGTQDLLHTAEDDRHGGESTDLQGFPSG
jgi:hypothetical protein